MVWQFERLTSLGKCLRNANTLAHGGVASSAGFGAFEKIKQIFSITPVESLERSRECWTLASKASDTEPACLVYYPFLTWLSTEHQTLSIERGSDTVHLSGEADVSKCTSECFLTAEASDARERPVVHVW